MLSKYLSTGLLALAVSTFIGCGKHAAAPTPSCYSGTVVGFNCQNGLLVEVDDQYPIGAPLRFFYSDSIPQSNIIAAVNQSRTTAKTGQRIYFTYVDDANQQSPAWPCTTLEAWIHYPVPHLVLSNVSVTPCGQPQSQQQ